MRNQHNSFQIVNFDQESQLLAASLFLVVGREMAGKASGTSKGYYISGPVRSMAPRMPGIGDIQSFGKPNSAIALAVV